MCTDPGILRVTHPSDYPANGLSRPPLRGRALATTTGSLTLKPSRSWTRTDPAFDAATADSDTGEGAGSAGEARRYPAGVNSGATTICTRDVVLSRISFTGW